MICELLIDLAKIVSNKLLAVHDLGQNIMLKKKSFLIQFYLHDSKILKVFAA